MIPGEERWRERVRIFKNKFTLQLQIRHDSDQAFIPFEEKRLGPMVVWNILLLDLKSCSGNLRYQVFPVFA